MAITVQVNGPHPCWIDFTLPFGKTVRLDHRELLELEHAVAEAKRQVLCKLDRRDWHELDPKLAAP